MSFRTTPPRPLKRKGFWYLSRRVPKAYQTHERREIVLIGTGVRISDDLHAVAAKAIIGKLDAELLTHWRLPARTWACCRSGSWWTA
ncbi:MAG: hypothetical protein AB7E81_00785 [Hyphomicrobiaceae bacterium]